MPMCEILVSIVIPVYNQTTDRLIRCLKSVDSQTYKNYEIVLVDDGSQCALSAAYEEISKQYHQINFYVQENKGSGSARNTGIENAKGEYIMFLDSDDVLSENALSDAIDCLQESMADLVVGQVRKFREEQFVCESGQIKEAKRVYLRKQNEIIEYINHILGYESERLRYKDRYFCDGPVAKLCKTELLKKALFGEEKFWGEDTIWNLIFTKLCKSIVISEAVWYFALSNSSSQTHIYRPNCEKEFLYRIQQEHEIVSTLWPECKEGLCIQIWLSMYYVFQCFVLHEENTRGIISSYKVFKNCISNETYRWMLRNIRFDSDRSTIKKVIKKIIRFFSLHGPKWIAYFGWIFILKSKNGER